MAKTEYPFRENCDVYNYVESLSIYFEDLVHENW